MNAMTNHGLIIDSVSLDGNFHRVKTLTSSKKNGWYVGNVVNNKIYCSFGDWSKGDTIRFTNGDSVSIMTEADKKVWREIALKSKEAEAHKHKEAAEKAKTFVEFSYHSVNADHEYLKNKKIKSFTAKQCNELLVLPLYDSMALLTGYQSISPTGEKRFLFGMKKKGCCHPIVGSEDIVLICEGFATGATLHEATGYKVLCAMDCNNLVNVAEIAKSMYRNILICADNDYKTDGNPGLKAAEKIKNKFKINYVYPKDIVGSDFNDLMQEKGIDAVSDAIFKTPLVALYQAAKQADFPQEIFNPPGLLKDIADYYNATAVKPQPLFAVATGLILGSILLGRRYKTRHDNYTALYFIVAAKSGTGKDHVKQISRKILLKAGLSFLESGEGFTASNTVIKSLELQPLQLSFFEEIGIKLQEAANNKRSLATGTFRKLLDIWSSAHSFSVGEVYSDNSCPKVERPSLTMVGITTPRAFTNSITDTLIEQGFVNRLLPFMSRAERTESELKMICNILEPPESVIKFAKKIWGEGNLSDIPNFPDIKDEIIVPFTEESIKFLNKIETEIIKKANKLEKIKLDDILSRNRELTMRVSLIVAVMDSKKEIELSHVKWSWLLVDSLYDEYVNRIKRNVFGSDFEKDKLEALQDLRSRGEAGRIPREFSKTSPWSKWKPKDIAEILRSLQDAKLIDQTLIQIGKRGPKTLVWVALA